MTILIIGSTGTLGRQIVREFLNHGVKVSCLVRNFKKANFLQEWGADLRYGDLKLPETIPNNLKGIKIIIDCSTFRTEDDSNVLEEIDLIGKLALIKSAQIANIKHFFFFSIKQNEKYQNVPLLKLKTKIQHSLKLSNLNYTIFQIDSFFQGLITQYAIPTLEEQTISVLEKPRVYSYINTQDISKIFIKLFLSDYDLKNSPIKKNRIIEINGPKIYNSKIILELTQEFTGQKLKIENISSSFLQISKQILSFSKWTEKIYNRLTFSEIDNTQIAIVENKNWKLTKKNLFIKKQDMTFLDLYLAEYFENMLKKLKDLNYNQNQQSKRKNLIF
jgi:uncharacterized protein YbjT (DUF2867 family)